MKYQKLIEDLAVIDYHKAHHPKDDVHSLYIKKQERGK